MIATENKPKHLVCFGGERDLPLGAVFHMDGDSQLVRVQDVGHRSMSECCDECYFQLVCSKLQNKAHEVIPQCSCDERLDGNDVFFLTILNNAYGSKCHTYYLYL